MARNADIQYIRHSYTNGTAARKIPAKKQAPKAPLPLFEPKMRKPDEKITVKVEILPTVTILTAAVLVVLMVLSLFQLSEAHQDGVALQEYVYDLRNEQVHLKQKYYEGFNLDEIRVQALALGMIPATEADVLQISGEIPAEPEEPTGWGKVQEVFRELFANIR